MQKVCELVDAVGVFASNQRWKAQGSAEFVFSEDPQMGFKRRPGLSPRGCGRDDAEDIHDVLQQMRGPNPAVGKVR